jgi:antitoxin component YwqK of YwqJK toxin-antitoxin module
MKKGVANGDASYWHGSGVLATQGKHVAGARSGTWPQWDPNGKLLAVTCYDKGEKTWISFEAIDAKVSCP